MKLNTLTKLMKWFSAISLACAATSLVGVPVDIDYNGSLADETGAVLDGDYYMQFAIATEDGSAVYWNNEEGSAASGLPATAVAVSVSQGVFSTVLEGVDSTVLGNPDLYLWVFVGDAAEGPFESLGAAPIQSVPYAVVAGTAETAESVDAANVTGDLGVLIPDGSINADKLGTILIDVPFIDADGDGVADAAGEQNVSMATILESISDNSKLAFQNVNANRVNYEVFLDLDQPVGSIEGWKGGLPTAGTFKDPFPVAHMYEYNGGLTPIIEIVDADNNVITGEAGNPIPGLTFQWITTDDVEGTSPGAGINDGLTEGRLIVTGAPDTLGDYTVNVRATNRWGMSFVQSYTVKVRDVDIEADVFLERQAMGSSVWTTDNADTPFGGDPVRARFVTELVDGVEEDLTDDTVVRWTYPAEDGSGPMTTDIPGNTGKIFYVNSDGDPVGTGASQGVKLLDENPLVSGVISHIGEYSAQILFDWGQGVVVGSDEIDDILDGYTYDAPGAISYVSPTGPSGGAPVPLFDPFLDNSPIVGVGTRAAANTTFGATPAGDQGVPLGGGDDWYIAGTIEAGETMTGLLGQDPWDIIDPLSYIRGSVTNTWIQQKVRKYTTSDPLTTHYDEIGVRAVESLVTINDVNDPTVDLAIDGFGPMPADADWPLPIHAGAGVIYDAVEKRAGYSYPQDGGKLTYLSVGGRIRPYQDDGNPLTIPGGSIENYLYGTSDLMAVYWLYSTNGFIDTLAPEAAIVEIGDNINIVNDLVDAQQVAGYSVQIGGDFGTTNGAYTSTLYPDEELTSTRAVIWGINDLAYIWSNPGGAGFEITNASNGNSILIAGTNLVNSVTGDNSAIDATFDLNLDSGFSNEGTSAGVRVISDIVVYDFHLQEVDQTKNTTDPLYYPQGNDITREAITIDAGDDVLLTVRTYIRPSLYTGMDDGGVTDGLLRDLSARFFLVPFQTNVAVEITNNITQDISLAGGDVDVDNDHVQGPIDNRVMVTWKVILDNPLQNFADTNIANGYVYAVISSSKDDVVINTVSTLDGASNQIAPNTVGINDDTGALVWPPAPAEQNSVGPDGTLDSRVKMPLDPFAGEGVITVNPL